MTEKGCYEYEEYSFEKPLLNVEATYIIHLKNNGRYESIIEQLKKYNISKKVFIVLNKGYKNCKKHKSINKPPLDLVDAYLEIFNHATNKDNILILEDDFFFDEKIKEPFHQKNINNFINRKDDFIYYLGTIPLIQLPHNYYHYNGFTLGAHAIIYSKKNREKCIKYNIQNRHKINDWDLFINFNNNYNSRFIYYTPLCYQLFTDTENSKHWGDHNIFYRFIAKIFIFVVKILKLHENINGYFVFYFFSKFVSMIIVLLLILLKLKMFIL